MNVALLCLLGVVMLLMAGFLSATGEPLTLGRGPSAMSLEGPAPRSLPSIPLREPPSSKVWHASNLCNVKFQILDSKHFRHATVSAHVKMFPDQIRLDQAYIEFTSNSGVIDPNFKALCFQHTAAIIRGSPRRLCHQKM